MIGLLRNYAAGIIRPTQNENKNCKKGFIR
jgi:hypothetical protein